MEILLLAAIILTVIHFGIPLTYYLYLKKQWLPKPWSIKVDPKYRPKITVIVPTYNEAKLIERKLEDIYRQDYPKDKLEIFAVDSASTDGTLEKSRTVGKEAPRPKPQTHKGVHKRWPACGL